MNLNELNTIEDVVKYQALKNIITIDDLPEDSQEPRTLLYGYTSERDTWHVYINSQYDIVTVLYGFEEQPVEVDVQDNKGYVPNKGLYPEACDFEFCKLLAMRGVTLPFIDYDDGRPNKRFYGKFAITDADLKE